MKKLAKIPIVLVSIFLDFYALLWIEGFFFERYDNPLRYFGAIYIPYIAIYFAVFIYFLTVAVRWIFGKCRKQMLLVFAFALFGLFALVFLRNV